MATIPTLTYLPSDENVILQLISRPLPADADLFDVADNCAVLVSVLVETDDLTSRTALCERLLQALHRLRKLCDVDLPPHLIEQLIMGEKLNSCVPDCWLDTLTIRKTQYGFHDNERIATSFDYLHLPLFDNQLVLEIIRDGNKRAADVFFAFHGHAGLDHQSRVVGVVLHQGVIVFGGDGVVTGLNDLA